MLTIDRLEIIDLEIPFRMTFKHAKAERSRGHSLLVRAVGRDGRAGYGECVPRSYVTGETPESVRKALSDELGPRFAGESFKSYADLIQALDGQLEELPRDRHAAFCALELALLDLGGHAFETSAGEAVAGKLQTEEVVYSAVVSADGVKATLATLEAIRKMGFDRVKIKVGISRDDDLALLRESRRILGQDSKIRIDANCAWSAEEALAALESFAPFSLESVEQPLAAADLAGLSWLTSRSPLPVIVDESLASRADARELVERKACHHFNIRISKCGGLINSVRLYEIGREAGIGCQLGAQVGETAVLSAAGRQFATRRQDILFHEGSYGSILLETDIALEDITIKPGGKAPALPGAGLGVDVDEARMARYSTNRTMVRIG